MKDIQVRIINLDFIPGPQADSVLREWEGVPGSSFCDSDRDAEALARSRIENICLVSNQEDSRAAVFWFRDEVMLTRTYRSAAHAYAAAADFIRQVEVLERQSVNAD